MRFIALLAVALVAGCTHTLAPGPESEQTVLSARMANNPPNAVGIVEDDAGRINWQTQGSGSTKAVTVTPDKVTQIGTGPATRQVVYQTDAAKFVLASESDFGIDLVDYNPADGRLVVKGFKTSASEPTNALAGTLAAWAPSFEKLSGDQKELVISAIKERQETIRQASPLAAGVLGDLIKALMVP